MVEVIDLTMSDEEEEMIQPKSKKQKQSSSADRAGSERAPAVREVSNSSNESTSSFSNFDTNAIAGSSNGQSRVEKEREIMETKQKITGISKSMNSSSDRYWTGAVRNVYNGFHPSTKNAMSFEDTLGPKEELKMALIATYTMETEWLFSHFSESTEIFICIPADRDDGEEIGIHPFRGRRNITRISPKLIPMHGMHMKLNVFVYHQFMRIIITTANCKEFDWKIMENVIYIHDFPLLSTPSQLNPTNDFIGPIISILEKLEIPDEFMEAFYLYDFASAAEIKTVVTHEGHYEGWNAIGKAGGLSSLAKAVKDFGFQGKEWEIEVAGSSLGKYSNAWLAQFEAACAGIAPKTYFKSGQSQPHISNLNNLKIVFPTLAEIIQTHKGKAGAGTIFCILKNWEEEYDHLRSKFYKMVNKRNKILSHSKTILATNETKKEGWVYIGSHNFTQAAWGRLTRAPGTKGAPGIPSSNNFNWELGVVIRISCSTPEKFESISSNLVSYQRPLEKFGESDVPWCQESHRDPK